MRKICLFIFAAACMMASHVEALAQQKISDTARVERIITIPESYEHENQLKCFSLSYKAKFPGYYNDTISDKNFDKTPDRLIPGRKYKVSFYKVLVPAISSEDLLEFRRKKGCMDGGPQALTIVFELLGKVFDRYSMVISIGEKEALWNDGEYNRAAWIGDPSFSRYKKLSFQMGRFEKTWGSYPCILCITPHKE